MRFFTFLLLLAAQLTFAQTPGKKMKGPATVGAYTVNEGDTLTLGIGTMPDGYFKFIYQPANYLLKFPKTYLQSSFASRTVEVRSLKRWKIENAGEKIIAIANPYGGLNHVVDLEAAITTGEITAINGKLVGKPTALAQPQQKPSSVADELLKFKQLLDSGAITQEEYDKQKKRLLDN